jgi:hypothetical protein
MVNASAAAELSATRQQRDVTDLCMLIPVD